MKQDRAEAAHKNRHENRQTSAAGDGPVVQRPLVGMIQYINSGIRMAEPMGKRAEIANAATAITTMIRRLMDSSEFCHYFRQRILQCMGGYPSSRLIVSELYHAEPSTYPAPRCQKRNAVRSIYQSYPRAAARSHDRGIVQRGTGRPTAHKSTHTSDGLSRFGRPSPYILVPHRDWWQPVAPPATTSRTSTIDRLLPVSGRGGKRPRAIA